MSMSVWYDRIVEEMIDPNEPAAELLRDAEAANLPNLLEQEDETECRPTAA